MIGCGWQLDEIGRILELPTKIAGAGGFRRLVGDPKWKV